MCTTKLYSFILVCSILNGTFSLTPTTTKTRQSSHPPLRVATMTDVSGMIPVDITIPSSIPTDMDQQAHPVQVQKPKSKPTFDTWKRRLNTKEDKLNLHKWSGLAFALSSTAILVTGLANGIHDDIPSFLEPFDMIFNLSILVQCVSSIKMADDHRRNQPATRDQFKALAYGMILSALVEWINGPFALDILVDNRMLSDVLIAGFGMAAVSYPLTGLFQKDELFKARRIEQNEGTISSLFLKGSFWFTSLGSPLIFMAMCAVFLNPEHDRAWMMQWQDDHAGQAATYYGQVYGNAATMWSGLITTLRDKKLIGKDLESLLTFIVLAQVPLSIFCLVK